MNSKVTKTEKSGQKVVKLKVKKTSFLFLENRKMHVFDEAGITSKHHISRKTKGRHLRQKNELEHLF